MGFYDDLPPDLLDRIDATLRRHERALGRSHFNCHAALTLRAAYLAMASRARGLDPDRDAGLAETSLDLLGRSPGDEARLSSLRTVARFHLARGDAAGARAYLDLCADADEGAGAPPGGGAAGHHHQHHHHQPSSASASSDDSPDGSGSGSGGPARRPEGFEPSALVRGRVPRRSFPDVIPEHCLKEIHWIIHAP